MAVRVGVVKSSCAGLGKADTVRETLARRAERSHEGTSRPALMSRSP